MFFWRLNWGKQINSTMMRNSSDGSKKVLNLQPRKQPYHLLQQLQLSRIECKITTWMMHWKLLVFMQLVGQKSKAQHLPRVQGYHPFHPVQTSSLHVGVWVFAQGNLLDSLFPFLLIALLYIYCSCNVRYIQISLGTLIHSTKVVRPQETYFSHHLFQLLNLGVVPIPRFSSPIQ